ncbi:beta-ketoacyl synthase N-terminal-like domain-containing protein [Vibrio tapetis]|uniref:Beta-ketoacyl synthase n=1 Tax=Vibrio tapetis subsp. tapetis TaxID=1671868 RepID=A0A2N8ZIU6_9VIBR|nr:polyketide synthase [Vibrio tapetis]SON51845.1 Beta-ketoacyl synthase [Vibrio tapetis subsp. tapetis]
MSEEAIAIVGMAGLFPKAGSVDELWQRLLLKEETIETIPHEALVGKVDSSWLDHPHYVLRASCLQEPSLFDASFFDITPAEAEMMDPQQRLFLQICWQSLENAGYPEPETVGLKTGVFGGCSIGTYFANNILGNPKYAHRDPVSIMMANDKDFLCTRVAYKLNLTGPAMTVQTACSTSLVAVHQACQALLAGECDLALAGGASISAYGPMGYLYSPQGIRSKDGHCRPFDHQSSGTLFGDGVGAVTLKRLEDAQSDNDYIYAVVRGSAVNNDGASKAGFTAPSLAGQTEVIQEAMNVAGVGPEEIHFVEAHGTATELGDPMELSALKSAYGECGSQYCALGSIKSNIGHLDCASGIAALIKAAKTIEQRVLPATLHYEIT